MLQIFIKFTGHFNQANSKYWKIWEISKVLDHENQGMMILCHASSNEASNQFFEQMMTGLFRLHFRLEINHF